MKRKPKWWNIDWVELGCRGWDITVIGAGIGENGEHDWQYAHLDRGTLSLLVSGRQAFLARVMTDLLAVGVLNYVEESGIVQWNMDVLGLGSGYPLDPTLTTNTCGSGSFIRLVS